MDAIIQGLVSVDDPEVIYKDFITIGHGATADIYKATNVITSEIVAIKRYTIKGSKMQEDDWRDIEKEIKIVSGCSHEHVLAYHGSYFKNETVWMVLGYCVGSCQDILKVFDKPFKEDEIRAVCYQTLLGLEYLHSKKKVHRDIKSGNILLNDDAQIKLADFGASADLINEGTASSFIGSPYWMAPEVILAMENGRYAYPVDVWSLGITLIELAETKPPLFNMHAMSALYHIPQRDPPTLQSPTWSADFVNFLSRCLLHEPSQRWTTTQLLQHPFLAGMASQGPEILRSLVQRSKAAVKKKDHDILLLPPARQLSEAEEEAGAKAGAADGAAGAADGAAGTGIGADNVSAGGGSEGSAAGTSATIEPNSPSSSSIAPSSTWTPDSTPVPADSKPKSTMAMAPLREESSLSSRLDTIKLSAQVAREQIDAHGGESVLLRQQMHELRKMRSKQDETLKNLKRKQQGDLEALVKQQQLQMDGLMRVHELEENSALRQRRQELDKLQRTQALERGYHEEELRKVSNKRVKDFRILLKAKLADYKKELKRRSKEKNDDSPDAKKARTKLLLDLETNLNATFEAEEMSRYTREMESLRAKQEVTEEKLKFEHLQQELDIKESHLLARIALIADHKTTSQQQHLREQLGAVHSLHLESQRSRHDLETSQQAATHERQRVELQHKHMKQNKKLHQKMKSVSLEDEQVWERFRRVSSATSSSGPTGMPVGSPAPAEVFGSVSSNSSVSRRALRENQRKLQTGLREARTGFVQDETIKLNKQQSREFEDLINQQKDERTHLLLYLQRQRDALLRTHAEEQAALVARNTTESDAADKYKAMEVKNFRQAKDNTLQQRAAQIDSFTSDRAPRMLAEAIVPKDIAELCKLPEEP